MSLVALLPVENLAAANATLAAWGPGPHFSVPIYSATGISHGMLHTWGPPSYKAAIKALAGVLVDETAGRPAARIQSLLNTLTARWSLRAPPLPMSGNAVAGTLYTFGGSLWWCVQTFSRTTFNLHPSTYPALIRRIPTPGEILPWIQPIDAFDAYFTVNKFTGQPDRVTFNGRIYRSAVPSVPNVWQPGGAEWIDEGAA